MQELIAFYRRELGLAGIDYCQLDTSQPLELGLMSYLMTRTRVLVMLAACSFLSPLFLIGAARGGGADPAAPVPSQDRSGDRLSRRSAC